MSGPVSLGQLLCNFGRFGCLMTDTYRLKDDPFVQSLATYQCRIRGQIRLIAISDSNSCLDSLKLSQILSELHKIHFDSKTMFRNVQGFSTGSAHFDARTRAGLTTRNDGHLQFISHLSDSLPKLPMRQGLRNGYE